ncbi:hypothetical protein LCGC14_1058110 [marine sediment metagenome]|uniref:DinB-like domain-containing protein n=1 Tax=marine sediment metagenome TaxID=412755 RepID=A0A0F9MRK1_9ZZZZ
MTIDEFFNPYDLEHIAAYKHLCDTGSWPEGFIPDSVDTRMESSPAWQIAIVAQLATCWVTHMSIMIGKK